MCSEGLDTEKNRRPERTQNAPIGSPKVGEWEIFIPLAVGGRKELGRPTRAAVGT